MYKMMKIMKIMAIHYSCWRA